MEYFTIRPQTKSVEEWINYAKELLNTFITMASTEAPLFQQMVFSYICHQIQIQIEALQLSKDECEQRQRGFH